MSLQELDEALRKLRYVKDGDVMYADDYNNLVNALMKMRDVIARLQVGVAPANVEEAIRRATPSGINPWDPRWCPAERWHFLYNFLYEEEVRAASFSLEEKSSNFYYRNVIVKDGIAYLNGWFVPSSIISKFYIYTYLLRFAAAIKITKTETRIFKEGESPPPHFLVSVAVDKDYVSIISSLIIAGDSLGFFPVQGVAFKEIGRVSEWLNEWIVFFFDFEHRVVKLYDKTGNEIGSAPVFEMQRSTPAEYYRYAYFLNSRTVFCVSGEGSLTSYECPEGWELVSESLAEFEVDWIGEYVWTGERQG